MRGRPLGCDYAVPATGVTARFEALDTGPFVIRRIGGHLVPWNQGNTSFSLNLLKDSFPLSAPTITYDVKYHGF